jgi:hypothetical protein
MKYKAKAKVFRKKNYNKVKKIYLMFLKMIQ